MPRREEGFGLVEAVLAMFIAGIVVSVIMSSMVASIHAMDRSLDTNEALNTSQSAVSRFVAGATYAENDVTYITATRLIYVSRGSCEEWQFSGTVLESKSWVPPAAYPSVYRTEASNVKEGSFALDTNTLTMHMVTQMEASGVIRTDRAVTSLYVATVTSPTASPTVAPSVAPRVNPCI